MLKFLLIGLILINFFTVGMQTLSIEKIDENSEADLKFQKRNWRNMRVDAIVYDLLTFETYTQFCSEDIFFVLNEFCSNFGGIHFGYKRSDQIGGIADECCYRLCNGFNVLKYCDHPHKR
jgi:hypothetical protein